MFEYFNEFELGVYPMERGAVVEIDSFKELVALDPSYQNFGENK